MNILSPTDSGALTELLTNNLPQVVLNTLCRGSEAGITQGGLVRELTRYLPSTVDPGAVRDHTQASLYWFLFNGDIAAAGSGQRYRIMPAYAIALPNFRGQPADERRIQLCGDPRRDDEIKIKSAALGGRWTSAPVERMWMIADDYRTVSVGIRRCITLAADRIAPSRSLLQEIQVPLLEMQELEQNLPNIAHLSVPPRSAFRALVPASGYWSCYAPAQAGDDRWMEIDTWNTIPAGQVVRWMPSLDWRGQRDSRYFYKDEFKDESPELAELSYSTACLWKFYIDREQQRPRQLWINGSELRLPISIPDPHRQWLQLLASNMHWRNPFLHYKLGVDPAPVAQVLAATLGLQIVHQRPA